MFDYIGRNGAVTVNTAPTSVPAVSHALEEAFEWSSIGTITTVELDDDSSSSDDDALVFVGEVRRGMDGLVDDLSLFEEVQAGENAEQAHVANASEHREKRPKPASGHAAEPPSSKRAKHIESRP